MSIILTQVGLAFLGWNVGKACDVGTRNAHRTILARLRAGKLDPNHDIERAILTAHYQALEFIVAESVRDGGLDAHGAGVINGRAFLQKRLKQVRKNQISTIAKYLAADWKGLIPASFDGANTSVPDTHVTAAIVELLRVKGWDDNEKTILQDLANNPDKGWVTAFSAYIREQLKTNEKFRHIYTEQVLDGHNQKLDAILAVMPDIVGMQQSLARIEAGQDKADAKLDAMLENQEKLFAMFNPQAKQRGVTEAALRAFIKKLGEERDLAADEMIPWLDGFIKNAQKKKDQKVNEDAPFQAALAEAKKRFDAGQNDAASGALMQELEREKQDEQYRQKERTRRRIHLLKEAIDYDELALEPEAAVKKWRLVAAEQGITSEADICQFLELQASNYAKQSEQRGSNSAALVAIAIYQDLLTIFPRNKSPHISANLQKNLGTIYHVLGQRGEVEMLYKAIKLNQNALKELTREKTPMDWAGTQNNLGNVYSSLGERGEDYALKNAITAYENSLKEYTREKVPMEWAMVQNNIGNAYGVLGGRGDYYALKNAVTAYEDALKERTREKVPIYWAMTQYNLGTVYQLLSQCGENGAVNHAVAAYENALKEYTFERNGMQWAITTENLGYVLWIKGDKTDAETCLRNALAYYRSVDAPYKTEKLENYMRRRGLEP